MAFTYKLVLEDGTPAGDFTTAVPNWLPGDTIPLGGGDTLRVVAIEAADDEDASGVLVVEAA